MATANDDQLEDSPDIEYEDPSALNSNAKDSEDDSGGRSAKVPRISKTRPVTSVIHRWFQFDGTHSKCNICSVRVSGKWPTNLENHLKRYGDEHAKYLAEQSKRATELRNSSKKKQKPSDLSSNSTIVDCFRKIEECKNGYKKGSDGYNKAVKSIGMAFVANSLSYRLIEDSFIRQMFAVVSEGRLTVLPDRHELSEKIIKMVWNLI